MREDERKNEGYRKGSLASGREVFFLVLGWAMDLGGCTQALKDGLHLQGRKVPALAFAEGLLVGLQPGSQGLGADTVHGSQFFHRVRFHRCLIRSAHHIFLAFECGVDRVSRE